MFLIKKNKRFKEITSENEFRKIVFWSIIVAIAGGRLLYLFTNWHEFTIYEGIAVWQYGGFSFLGSLLAIISFIPLYLKKLKIPILPFCDLVCIYAPLLYSISRVGCFLAGCCHGKITNSIFGVVYTHPDVMVPASLKFVKIHPTQLYSSIFMFIAFLLIYYIFQYKFKKPGQIFMLYLISASIERFTMDFFRGDLEIINLPILKIISIHQWISLSIFIFAISMLVHIKETENASIEQNEHI